MASYADSTVAVASPILANHKTKVATEHKPAAKKNPKPLQKASQWQHVDIQRETVFANTSTQPEKLLGLTFEGARAQPQKEPLKPLSHAFKFKKAISEKLDASIITHDVGLPLEWAQSQKSITDSKPLWLVNRAYQSKMQIGATELAEAEQIVQNLNTCNEVDKKSNVWVISEIFIASGLLVFSSWDRGPAFQPQVFASDLERLRTAKPKIFSEFVLTDAHALCAELRTVQIRNLVKQGITRQTEIEQKLKEKDSQHEKETEELKKNAEKAKEELKKDAEKLQLEFERLQKEQQALNTALKDTRNALEKANGSLGCTREALEASIEPNTTPLEERIKKCVEERQ